MFQNQAGYSYFIIFIAELLWMYHNLFIYSVNEGICVVIPVWRFGMMLLEHSSANLGVGLTDVIFSF